ncbi:MAG: hypothetical protein KC502_17290, partial [Myxococcales bacterium]|nr:hypothetical protein [Myxococcales bacterium]
DKQASVHNFLQKGDARPTVVAGPNGMRVVSFDGKDWMSSGTAFSGITKKFAYTIIVVGHGQDDDNAFLAGTEAKTNLPGLLVETAKAGNVRVLHRMPFGKAGGDDITTAKDPLKKKVLNRIWITRKVATKVSYGIKVNDELTGLQTGSAADFDADLNLVIGRESVVTDSRYLTGEIAEILIYLGEQTPNNNPAIHKYLQDKWGAK